MLYFISVFPVIFLVCSLLRLFRPRVFFSPNISYFSVLKFAACGTMSNNTKKIDLYTFGMVCHLVPIEQKKDQMKKECNLYVSCGLWNGPVTTGHYNNNTENTPFRRIEQKLAK